jgi:beta-N-acetylhexosaminidase
MTTRELGQLLIVGVPGTVLDPDTAARFRKLQPGGFILFTRNIESPTQLRKLIDALRDLSDIEPIITVDQEGGRVSRLKMLGNEPPNARQLAATGDPELIRRHGELTGRLLRLFGFNLDLCPVLDIDVGDDADNSLRGRCYGRTPFEVIENAGAFNDALRAEGILSCGKHFPGYSLATVDPHYALPVIERSREQLEANELIPFRALLARCDSAMIGHAWFKAFDPERTNWPSSLSDAVITECLRRDLGFDGLVMTDDLDMGAVLERLEFGETIRQAITAGNDMAMICHRIAMAEEAKRYLAGVDPASLDRALENVAALKRRLVAPDPFSDAAFEALDASVWALRVATLGEEAAMIRSPEDGSHSPVEVY